MFAIVNARIDPVRGPIIPNGCVLVKDDKVAGVGAKVAVPKDARRIDAGGRLLTPGFIDAHSHAGLYEDGMPNDDDYNEVTDPVTPQVNAIDAFRPTDVSLLEAAQAGVTSIMIAPGSANVIGGMCAVVKTLAKPFSRQIVRLDVGLKLATGENPKRVYGGQKKMPASRMGTAAVMRAALNQARLYLAKRRAHARKKGKGPFETNLAMEAISGMLQGRYGARCHAHRAIDMLTAMRIAEEYGFRLTFEHATECEDILPELARAKIPVVIGPTMWSRRKIEVQHRSFASVAAAVKAGLLVAITCDAYVTPLQYLPVCAALAIRAGLSPADALRVITINPARICGVEDRLGSIERGKDADLVLWEGNPFDARTRPAAVWISGEEVDLMLKSIKPRG